MVKKEPYPSSSFDCVKPRMIPTRTLQSNKKVQKLSDARNFLPDEMSLFLQLAELKLPKNFCSMKICSLCVDE